MALKTLKWAADELGYKSQKSVKRLARLGHLKIKEIPGEHRPTLRVDSAEIERIKSGREKKEPGRPNTYVTSRGRRRNPRVPGEGSHLKRPKPLTAVRHYA